jgi:phage terminase large subunit-like protein
VLETGSFFRPVSSEKRGLDGKRVHGALVDELHEHASAIVVDKMRAGTKGRRSALILEITNSGYDRESVCFHHHDYSRQILEGSIANEAWFGYVCGLDPCTACLAAGKLQPSEDCAACDDWQTEGPHWLKANPNLGISLPWQYLREQVREAIDMPSKRNIVKRLNFCMWTDQVTVWIPTEKWAACRAPWAPGRGGATPASLLGRDCFVGIDCSEKIDLTSVVLGFPRDAEALAVALGPDAGEIEGLRGDGERTINLNLAFDLIPFFWLPKNVLTERVREDKVPYDRWAEEGWLTPTPGNVVDQDAILHFILNDLAKKYRIRGFGIDQAGAVALLTRLVQHFGPDVVTEVPQGFKHLNDPSKTFEALVVSQRIAHDGNPVMGMCVANAGKEENNWQEIRPVKMSQRKRIDGVVATIDMLAIALKAPPDGGSKYEREGLVTV